MDQSIVRNAIFLVLVVLHRSSPSPVDNTSPSNGITSNYGLLLDAGSSSSKIKLFRWTAPSSPNKPLSIRLEDNKKFKPAISTIHDNTALQVYFEQISSWARKRIPSSAHRTTPVFVMATAGMRFLSEDASEKLLDGIRQILQNSSLNPFATVFDDDVSVLSGEEEGVYSWVAANYILGFFDSERLDAQAVGVLEMGGGSTQITFVPDGPLYAEEFQVRLVGRTYSLYVHSYLGYGVSAFEDRVAYQLYLSQQSQTDLASPCMLGGDTSEKNVGSQITVSLNGTGNPAECTELLEEILTPVTGMLCQPKPCVVGPTYQPPLPNITFFATQAYINGLRFSKAVGPDGSLDIEALKNASFKHCNRSLEEALKNPNVSQKYASSDCLMGLYIPLLLTSYGFDLHKDDLKITSKIDGQKIDWALGAMLVRLTDRFSSLSASDKVVTPAVPQRMTNHSCQQTPFLIEILIAALLCLQMYAL